MVLSRTHELMLLCSNKQRNVLITLQWHSIYIFQRNDPMNVFILTLKNDTLHLKAQQNIISFNTRIHILIYFLAHSLGWQVKMCSSLIQQEEKGCLCELMSFSTVCTNTLTHSIRFPPYDSVSLQSYSDLREPNGAAPWVSRPDQ